MSTPQPNKSLEAALALQEPFLQRLARALVEDEHAASDLVQDTVARALQWAGKETDSRRRKGLESLTPLRLQRWLATVLRNTSIDRARRSRTAERVDSELLGGVLAQGEGPDEIALRLERQQLLHGSLMALPEALRTVLVLRYQDGLTLTGIAASTGSPLPTVKSRVRRGLDRLKDELARASGQEEAEGLDWLTAVAHLAYPKPIAHLGLANSEALPFWTLVMWKPLALIVVAAFLACAFVIATRESPLTKETQTIVGVAPVPSDLDASVDNRPLANTAGAGRQLAGSTASIAEQELAGGPRLPLMGTVISTSSGEPIPALVQLGPRASTRASMASGGFLLEVPARVEPTLRVEHPLFEPFELPIPPRSQAKGPAGEAYQALDVIRLTPKGHAEVRVIDAAGGPVVGAECTLHRWLKGVMGGYDRLRPTDRPRPLGVTQAGGLLRVPLAFEATISVPVSYTHLTLPTIYSV